MSRAGYHFPTSSATTFPHELPPLCRASREDGGALEALLPTIVASLRRLPDAQQLGDRARIIALR
jgi:hypothetical protein